MITGPSAEQLQDIVRLVKIIESNPDTRRSFEKLANSQRYHLLFLSAWQPGKIFYGSVFLFFATLSLLSLSAVYPEFRPLGSFMIGVLLLELLIVYSIRNPISLVTHRYILRGMRKGAAWDDVSSRLISQVMFSRASYLAQQSARISFPRYLLRLRVSIGIHESGQVLKWTTIICVAFTTIISMFVPPPIPVSYLLLVFQMSVALIFTTFLVLVVEALTVRIARTSRPSLLYVAELRQVVREFGRSQLLLAFRKLYGVLTGQVVARTYVNPDSIETG